MLFKGSRVRSNISTDAAFAKCILLHVFTSATIHVAPCIKTKHGFNKEISSSLYFTFLLHRCKFYKHFYHFQKKISIHHRSLCFYQILTRQYHNHLGHERREEHLLTLLHTFLLFFKLQYILNFFTLPNYTHNS